MEDIVTKEKTSYLNNDLRADKAKYKVIRDSVHGYIYIDCVICEEIIDTEIFQRLRRIEQTSMRCLYPAASHDRFIHSLGVYNLAKIALKTIEKNIIYNAYKLKDIVPEPDMRTQVSFCLEMAALLHDVGHAPFSHTLEGYFGIETEADLEETQSAKMGRKRHLIENIYQELLSRGDKKSDISALKNDLSGAGAAQHELMSSLIVIQKFCEAINSVAQVRRIKQKVDFELIVRCITGAQYKEGDYKEYKNCIIRLLNSSIDIDKLDYISRDSSISGYDNVKIDISRLLKALVVELYKNEDDEERITIAFGKNAISVVQNVITARNSLYTWIYAHHKIKYETYLIQKAIKEILNRTADSKRVRKRAGYYKKYFSVRAITENLICDADIWCLLKKNRDMDMVEEIFDRRKQKKAVWKSFSEFNILFQGECSEGCIGEFSLKHMQEFLKDADNWKEFEKYINQYDNGHERKASIDLIVHNVKLTKIKPNSILIQLDGKLYNYDMVVRDLYHNSLSEPFFYLFCNKEDIKKIDKNDLVQYIKKYSKFNMQPDYA